MESAEQNVGPGSSVVINGPHQTPVSGKAGKPQKVPRTAKANKVASQTLMANTGENHYHSFYSFSKSMNSS